MALTVVVYKCAKCYRSNMVYTRAPESEPKDIPCACGERQTKQN